MQKALVTVRCGEKIHGDNLAVGVCGAGDCKQRPVCHEVIWRLWHQPLIISHSVLEVAFTAEARRHSFNQKVVFHQTPLLY